MSDLPPPPSDPFAGVPTPRPAVPRRPGIVTGAAAILIVAGAIALLAGVVVLSGGGSADVPGLEGRTVVGTLALVVGAVDVLAGWLILRLSPGGRVLGIVIAVLGILTGLAQLGGSGPSGLLGVALYGFVLYALVAYGFVFRDAAAAR